MSLNEQVEIQLAVTIMMFAYGVPMVTQIRVLCKFVSATLGGLSVTPTTLVILLKSFASS